MLEQSTTTIGKTQGESKGRKDDTVRLHMHTAKNVSYANTLYTAFVLCTNPTLEHPDDKEGKNTDDHSELGSTVS